MDLVGWATEGSGTTGGGSDTPKVVTSSAELKSLAGDGSPQVIHLSGTFTGGFTVKSNKTIIGKGAGTVINGGGVSIRGSNIIIRNITIKGGTDTVESQESNHIWLDHLDVSDGSDGVIDLTRSSNHATISWNRVHYNRGGAHRFALLFGNGSGYTADKGHNNHTIHHNWFGKGVDQRMPRLLFGRGHMYNNYYNSPGNTYCIGAGSWASILVEANYFKDVADPHRFQDGNSSHITAKDNVYINTTGKKDEGAGGSGGDPPGPWAPTYSYKPDKAEDVPSLVERCSGPQASLLN
jgi:pectate lyase